MPKSNDTTIPQSSPGRNMDPYNALGHPLGIDHDTQIALVARAVQSCRDVFRAQELLREAIDRMDFFEEALEASFDPIEHDEADRDRVRRHWGYDAFTDSLADFIDEFDDLAEKWPALLDVPPADQRGGYMRMDIINRNITSLLGDGIDINEIHHEIDMIGPFVSHAQDWSDDDLGDSRFGRMARIFDDANRAMCARLRSERSAA